MPSAPTQSEIENASQDLGTATGVKVEGAAWRRNPSVMAALQDVQNHPRFANQDIMSFAGMCSTTQELLAHFLACDRLTYTDEAA